MLNKEIDLYISSLNYNIKSILAIPGERFEVIPGGDTSQDNTSEGVVICHRKKSTLDTSFDSGYILAPISDTVWPSNLIKLDSNLAEGIPSEIRLKRASNIKLWIDLPGLEDGGIFEVSEVSMQGVNSRIQEVVDHWVNEIKPAGYDIKSDISFNSTTFYSKEQALGSLGVSYKDLSTSVSAALSVESNSEKQTSMAMLKQTYYSVFYNPGSSPSLLLSDDVSLDDVKLFINEKVPPAYISQLDYGRIVFFKLETSSSSTNVDLEALMKYGKGEVEISAEMKAKYEFALKDSKLSVITIGGNANTNIEIVSVKDIDGLLGVIKDKESVSISNTNMGVPISYTTKQLKDSALAKRYLVTDYITNECKLYKNGWIELKHSGGYVAHFYVSWQEKGKSERSTWESGNTTAGYTHKLMIPATATDVRCDAWVYTGLVWQPQSLAYRNTFEGAPNCRIVIKGTTLKPYAEVVLS